MILASVLALELVRHSLAGTHCRYREYVDGLPTETYVTSRCGGAAAALAADSASSDGRAPDAAAAPQSAALSIVNGRRVRREIVEEEPLRPFAYDYDDATGELLRRVPLFFNDRPARVFDPNPVATLNDPSLQDRNDSAAAVPDAAYSLVDLPEVADSGALRGPHATLIDRQAPSVAPPDAAGSLVFNREQDGFEDVNAYFHIDRTQRYLQFLGYSGRRAIVPYSIEVDAHSANGADNSFFLPAFFRIGHGTLHFGEGGTDDAEDADLVVHEYGHAMLEWIAPGTFTGPFASEARALSEGFGDYWAFSQHVDTRTASGRDPFCFADWDARCWEDDASQRCAYPAGTDCLRRLDSTRTMADYDRRDASGVEHRNGMIWSSALRELHQRIGRVTFDTILLESLFDMPPQPTFTIAAHRLVAADRLLFGGTHAAAICAAMTARAILASCDGAPRGEQTLFQSGERALPIPDNVPSGLTSSLTISDTRAIERLFVRVDVAHATRGDLRLELISPAGTTILLQQFSSDLARDIRATYGLTAVPAQSLDVLRGESAAGTWRLVLRDLRARDAGTLLSWGLLIQFAGDAPLAIRPRAAAAQMIPVVTRLYGVGPTLFASDLRVANPRAEPQVATLIFTRSGEDGRTSFAAIQAAIAPGQTVAFDDVVASVFHTTGSGSLEILGDVVVMSRTYAATERRGGPADAELGGGTLGQQVPANLDTTTLGAPPLVAAPIRGGDTRVNFGVTEVAGGSGVVRVGTREIAIAPFSHLQFPMTEVAVVRVVSGDARVVAYLSQLDNRTNDPMFIAAEAERDVERTLIAPVASTVGAGGNAWISDLWLVRAGAPEEPVTFEATREGESARAIVPVATERVFVDVLRELFPRSFALVALRVTVPPRTFATTRVRVDGISQSVPLREPDGPREQHLLFIETSEPYRANIGLVSDGQTVAEAVVYDASGTEVQRELLFTRGGIAQMPVAARVVNGRASVRFLSGRGRAYASLIDNRTGDATYVEGQ